MLGVISQFYSIKSTHYFSFTQILETGFTYQYYSVKGLELQETSCHTAEASRVDANFSRAFDLPESGMGRTKGNVLSSFMNRQAFHTLTPLTRFSVPGYSDTRNVLTGVLDSPDTLGMVRDYFLKALVYVLVEHAVGRSIGQPPGPPPTQGRPPTTSKSQEHLRNLPRVSQARQSTLESPSPIESEEDSPVTSLGGRRMSHSSWQSGRGSRIAWAGEQRDIPIVRTGDTPPPLAWDTTNEHNHNNWRSGHHRPVRVRGQGSASSLDDPKTVSFIPGIMYDSNSEDEYSPHTTTNHHTQCNNKSSRVVNLRVLPRGAPPSPPIYESPLSAALAPPPDWMTEPPLESEALEEAEDAFPHAWFKFLLTTFGHVYLQHLDSPPAPLIQPPSTASSSSGASSTPATPQPGRAAEQGGQGGQGDTVIQRMQYDETLEDAYR